MLSSILAQIVAGLGLFFFGIKTLTTGMQEQATYQVRRLISRTVSNPFSAAVIGMLAGFLLQKPSGVISILAGMQTSGALTISQALPIVAWCNIGLSFIAFITLFDIKIAVGFTVGLSGFLLMFVRNKRYQPLLRIIFGAALLLYGLDVMKSGAGAIQKYQFMQDLIGYTRNSYLISLGVGALVAAITQSFLGVAILCIALVKDGFLGDQQAMMMIYGANFGVGFFRRVFTASLTGEGKQLFLFQNIFRYGGTLSSVALFYLGRVNHIPIMLHLARMISDRIDFQMGVIFAGCNFPALLLCLVFHHKILNWLLQKSPPATEDQLSCLKFLTTTDVTQPQNALIEIQHELAHSSRLFSKYACIMRNEKGSLRADGLHGAMKNVLDKIEDFANELVKQPLDTEQVQTLSRLNKQRMLISLIDEALFQMTTIMRGKACSGSVLQEQCLPPLVEGLDTILLTLEETLRELEQQPILLKLTGDRTHLMDQYRKRLLIEYQLNHAEENAMIEITNLYEQLIWMINRLTGALSPSALISS